MKTNWTKLIDKEMQQHCETFSDVEACTLTWPELDREFDAGSSVPCGTPFTLWTHHRVYFPVQYDGAESVRSVARRPDSKPTPHVGS